MNDWGVTDKGFHRPVYAEILDALEYKARELFGAKINVRLGSPLGLFLRLFAWVFDMLFKLLEDVYNSRFVDTAVGASLYNIGRTIGLWLLPAQKAKGYLQITGRPETVIPAGFLAATVQGVQYVVLKEDKIGADGVVKLPIQAFNAGPDGNAGADTITEIVNPYNGVESVTNPKPVDGGRDRETDEEYRDRYYQSVDFAGGVNAEAIAGEILQTVEGVQSALIYENDTDFVDELGLTPHSIEAVVYGGLDEDVARAIFRRKAAGIQTNGNTVVSVLNTNGQAVEIRLSRPQPVPIWFKVTNLTTTSNFPEDGKAQIKHALVEHIGGDAAGGLSIGTDVIYMTLPAVVFAVPGVRDFKLLISQDGEVYGTDNVLTGMRQKAVTDESKVVFE